MSNEKKKYMLTDESVVELSNKEAADMVASGTPLVKVPLKVVLVPDMEAALSRVRIIKGAQLPAVKA